MLATNTSADPIVEILRLAYRRGLALRQEQEKIASDNSESNRPDRQVWTNSGDQLEAQTIKLGKTLS
jgi:hypothetical protein